MFILFPVIANAGVANTKHNLSISNPIPGSIKAASETQICIFCHTPHNASPAYPLWNHEISSGLNYTQYASDTLKAYSPGNAPPIDGFSKLCLGCHDGTIALGAIINGGGSINVGTMTEKDILNQDVLVPRRLQPGDPGYLGTDLSGGHPISIIFDAKLVADRNGDQTTDPNSYPLILMKLQLPNDPYVKLYPTQGGQGVQCTSCHDPHGGRGKVVNGVKPPPFWQKETYSDVCEVCHVPNDRIPVDVGHNNPKPTPPNP